jgi:hypothetical protein
MEDGNDFGTHKLIFIKNRFLGSDIAGAVEPVRMPDGNLRRNFINLRFNNFDVTEHGDLRDIVRSMDTGITRPEAANEQDDVPDFNA